MPATYTRYTRTTYNKHEPVTTRLPFRKGQVLCHLHRHNGALAKLHACTTVPLVQAQQLVAIWNATAQRTGSATVYSL